MKRIPAFLLIWLGLSASVPVGGEETIDPEIQANLVILDEAGAENLGIEIIEASEETFEETVFALGRIEAIPSRQAVVSSRIPGRIAELKVYEGDTVTPGQTLLRVESRLPNPPPPIALHAPIAGLISNSRARLGEPVSPDEHLLEIVDLSKVYAIARVPEDLVGQLERDSLARITVSALPGEPFEGKLLRFGTSADSESGTLDVVFEMDNASGRLRPGMRAEFSIVIAEHEDVTSIPLEALQGTPSDRYVFVKYFELPNAYLKSKVIAGMRNERYVEIVAGLFPADEVVTKGAYSLGFAGAGAVSLKEALDAAHGHEHNPDGSEITAEQKATVGREDAGHDHGHEHSHSSGLTIFLGVLSSILFILLLLVSLKKNPGTQEDA